MLSTGIRARSALRVGGALLCLIASASALWAVFSDINVFPRATGDEWYLLSRYERLVEFGDFRDVAMFDRFTNHREHSKQLPLAAPLRYGLHRSLGIGAPIARTIGAAEMAILAILIALLVRRRGSSIAATLLGPCIFLSFNTVFVFARTFRYEQDVVFFGTLSLLVPMFTRTRRAKRAGSLLSGILSGTAACIHPMGAIFPVALMLSVVIRARWLGIRDVARGAAIWLTGLALPVLATLVYYARDWQNTISHYRLFRVFYGDYGPIRVRAMLSLAPVPEWLPDQLGAALNSVRWGLSPFVVEGQGLWLRALIAPLWGVALAGGTLVASVFVFQGLSRRPTAETEGRWADVGTVWSCAAVTAFVFTAVVLPNTDYALYFNGIAWTAVYLLAARLTAEPRGSWRTRAGFGLIIVLAVAGLSNVLTVSTEAQPRGASVPVQIDAMKAIARELRVGNQPDEPMYADLKSWAGAGHALAPLTELIPFDLVERRKALEGVVLSTTWYNDFIQGVPSFRGEPINVLRRRRAMESLIQDLEFTACLVTENSSGAPLETVIWLTHKNEDKPLFAVVNARGRLSMARGEHVTTERFGVRAGSFSVARSMRLPPGRYAAMVTGAPVIDSQLRITARDEDSVRSGSTLQGFPHSVAGAITVFEVARGDFTAHADGSAVSPGRVRIGYWRLED